MEELTAYTLGADQERASPPQLLACWPLILPVLRLILPFVLRLQPFWESRRHQLLLQVVAFWDSCFTGQRWFLTKKGSTEHRTIWDESRGTAEEIAGMTN